jgi:hypothetical protein
MIFSKRIEEHFIVITFFVSANIKYKTTITTSSFIQIDGLQYIRLNYERIFFNIK